MHSIARQGTDNKIQRRENERMQMHFFVVKGMMLIYVYIYGIVLPNL
jgi:hypothetical protein